MSTAVRLSASLCLVLALIFPCLMTETSSTAYADDRIDQRAVDRWISDSVQTEGLSGASVAGSRSLFSWLFTSTEPPSGPANTPIPSGSLG